VRRLATPEPCLVAFDGRAALGLDWRGRRRLVQRTLEIWCYRSSWWRDERLCGEEREYHTVLTTLGDLELMCVVQADRREWFVVAIWD
jgi:hypothetical protein